MAARRALRDGGRKLAFAAAAALSIAAGNGAVVPQARAAEANTPAAAAARAQRPAQESARRLMEAVLSGDAARVGRLAPAFRGVTVYDGFGFTPLVWASGQRSPAVATELLRHGQSPNTAAFRTGWTPLMSAAMTGNQGTVSALLAAGADPAAIASDGTTAAAAARAKGHEEIATRIEAAAAARRGGRP